MILYLLIWAAIGALLPSMLTAHSMLGRDNIAFWKRVLIAIICGPSMWLILIGAVLLAFGASVVRTVRLRRAKKSRP